MANALAQKTPVIHLLKLRIAVGLLGEVQSPAWWPSAFFSRTSPAFLKHTFGRTMALVQYHGVCEAATRVHDDHIGIGAEVFHLFRLPERLERDLHELWRDVDMVRDVSEHIHDQPTAQANLRQYAHESDVEGGDRYESEVLQIWTIRRYGTWLPGIMPMLFRLIQRCSHFFQRNDHETSLHHKTPGRLGPH